MYVHTYMHIYIYMCIHVYLGLEARPGAEEPAAPRLRDLQRCTSKGR